MRILFMIMVEKFVYIFTKLHKKKINDHQSKKKTTTLLTKLISIICNAFPCKKFFTEYAENTIDVQWSSRITCNFQGLRKAGYQAFESTKNIAI